MLYLAILFIYPVLSFLWRREYPVLATEAVLLLLIPVLAAAGLGSLLAASRSSLRNAMLAVLTCAVLVLQFDLKMEVIIPTVILLLPASILLGDRFHRLGTLVLLGMLTGAFADARIDRMGSVTGTEPDTDPSLPTIVHVLLDSFIGVAGLPSSRNAEVFGQDVMTLMSDWAFTHYPSAFSRHAITGDSMYLAMDFREDGDSSFVEEIRFRKSHALDSNAYFERLGAMGYRIDVLQTEFLDFCQEPSEFIASCRTYLQPNVLTIASEKNPKSRFVMLGSVMLSQSDLYRELLPQSLLAATTGIGVGDTDVFRWLDRQLSSGARGRAYFVHALLPHGPFVFQPDCEVTYETTDWERVAGRKDEPKQAQAIYDRRYFRYFLQAQCTLLQLRWVLEGLSRRDQLDETVVLVHGDHGSLIAPFAPSVVNASRLTPADMRAHYSTLFAYRLPNAAPELVGQALPLSTLLRIFTRRLEAIAQGRPDPGGGTQPGDNDEVYLYLGGTHPRTRVDTRLFEPFETELPRPATGDESEKGLPDGE